MKGMVRTVAAVALALLPGTPVSRVAASGTKVDPRVACALRGMSLRDKVGQVAMVAVDGTRPTLHTIALLRAWRAGGVILFGNNIGTAADLQALTSGLQRAARLPLVIATDQEGGPVTRITVGLTPMPSPATYATGAPDAADRLYRDALAQGFALKRLGINLNLAPVVDVRSRPDSAIGVRSFGPDPSLDARLASAAIRGYQAAGIGATAKHFLGLGSVSQNADYVLPAVTVSRAVLEQREMVPVRAAIRAAVAALMVTRVVIPALDPRGSAAYASTPIVQGVIRGELHYTGVVITDSLLSDAVLAGPGATAAAVAALRAGDDLLLLGTGGSVHEDAVHAALAGILAAVANGTLPSARVDEAARHVLLLKARLGLLRECR